MGSEKSSRKSFRKSHPNEDEDEDPGDTGLKAEGLESILLSRDNVETQSESVAHKNIPLIREACWRFHMNSFVMSDNVWTAKLFEPFPSVSETEGNTKLKIEIRIRIPVENLR